MPDFEFENDQEQEQPSESQREQRQSSRDSRNESRQTRGESRGESVGTGRGMSLLGLSTNRLRTSIGGISDAAMQTITKVFESARDHESASIPDEIKRKNFKFLPMMGQSSNQNPCLIITLPVTSVNKLLAYVLLFEQPNAVQQTRPLTEGRESYESLVLLEDQVNDRFMTRLATQLDVNERDLILVNYEVILAEHTELLSHGDEHDAAISNLVAGIVNNAIDALSGSREILMQGDVTETSLTPHSVEGGVRMEVVFNYPTYVKKDGSGNPVATDVSANVFFTRPNPDDSEIQDRVLLGEALASLDLYLDLDYEEERGSFGRSRRQEARPFWQPVLEIRGLPSAPDTPYSLSAALYQMAQLAPLVNGERWARALFPRPVTGGSNGMIESLVDLGVLNMFNPDTSAADYIDNLTANTPETDLTDYLSRVVRDEISIGLTLPVSNDKSWVLSIFEQMATLPDGETRRNLVKKLYQACNTLTGNRFSETIEGTRLMDRDYCPIESTGVRELIGFWTDDNGNLRSLAEWNVAAYASRVAKRPNGIQLVYDFQATYEATENSRNSDKLLSQRFEILRRDVASNIRLIGSAEKMAVDVAFVRALCDSLEDGPLEPVLANADSVNRTQRVGRTIYRKMAGRDFGHSGRHVGGRSGGRSRSVYGRNRTF